MPEADGGFKFGVSQYTTWEWTIEQDLEAYAALGVDCVEVCEFKLDVQRMKEQLALVGERGLTISSVQPQVHTLYPDSLEAEPTEPQARAALIRRAIERVGPHAPEGTPFVVNTGAAPGGNFREAHAMAEREFRALARFAADHGMRVALEPLNAILMNTNSFLWLIPQVMDMIARVDHPAFGLCMDTWNVWQDPKVLEHIAACGDKIFVTHVSDWHLPRAFADRAIIGQGEIPLPALLRAIDETGYGGAYSLEIFSDTSLPDSLWKADGRQVIQDSWAGLERAWREASL
ncbi:MAG: sugar phosphate isomerase/epimerase [Armatimonadetes bacterium]|nr:sugar phosphate isomerase/epimerase [Armatimonadota bacterium]